MSRGFWRSARCRFRFAGETNHLRLAWEEKKVVSLKNRAKRDCNRRRRDRDRRRLRQLQREMKDIVVEAKRRRILKQVESTDPVIGDCWQLLRALGRGGDYPNAPLRDWDRFVFDEKD